MKKIKLLEMGSEGGSITLFKTIDSQNRESYSYAVNEMDYELEDLTPVNFSSESVQSFEEAYRILKNKYPHLLMLYPVFMDTSIVDFISNELKKDIDLQENGFQKQLWIDKINKIGN